MTAVAGGSGSVLACRHGGSSICYREIQFPIAVEVGDNERRWSSCRGVVKACLKHVIALT